MNLICIPEADIREKARKTRIGYLEACQARSTPNDKGEWCFTLADWVAVKDEFSGYTRSETDRFEPGKRISGCCDRADQY